MERIKNFLKKVWAAIVFVYESLFKIFNFITDHPYILLLLQRLSQNSYGRIGKLCFCALMFMKYGKFVFGSAKKAEASVNKIAKRYDRMHKVKYGRSIGYKEKARVFDNVVKKKVLDKNGVAPEKIDIPVLREHVWTLSNWEDKERRARQQERIDAEGGKPLPFDTIGSVL